MSQDLLNDCQRHISSDQFKRPGMSENVRMGQAGRDPSLPAELAKDAEEIRAVDCEGFPFHSGILREIAGKLVDSHERDRNYLPCVFPLWVVPLENVHRNVAGAEVDIGLVIYLGHLGNAAAGVPQKKIDQEVSASSPGEILRGLVVENLKLFREVVQLLFVQVVDSFMDIYGQNLAAKRL